MTKLTREYSKDLNILYVEDDKELCHSTREVFENFFNSVDIAYDGQLGLEAYKDYFNCHGVAYDLVITDINMPKMNGIELCHEILKVMPQQHIVIISAHNEVDYLFEAINVGVSAFITKPINQKRLIQIIYKTSMAISDHKFVMAHVDNLESLTLKLEANNQELSVKNKQLEKSLRLLDTVTNKEELQFPIKKIEIKPPTAENSLLKEQIKNFIEDDLSELKDLLNEVDLVIIDIINNINDVSINSRLLLVSLFKKYALILSMYPFFDELSVAMSSFAHTLEVHPLPKDKQRVENIFLLLESFVFDLGKWHKVLSLDDENKFNAFDASNIGNMRLITNMWLEDDSSESTSEDLDSIFDF
jgi:YesN/AraC family two-component response regulator